MATKQTKEVWPIGPCYQPCINPLSNYEDTASLFSSSQSQKRFLRYISYK